jgi:hypothetical protein
MLTDQAVTETAARYANSRPGLDTESQHAILAANDYGESTANTPVEGIRAPEVIHSAGDRSGPSGADEELWLAPDEGTDVGELLLLTGMSRPILYRASGRARQGRPRRPGQPGTLARHHHRGATTVSDRLTVRLISRLVRASARKRAYTPAETNTKTTTHRHLRAQ